LSYIVIVIACDASTLILLAKTELLDRFLENVPEPPLLPRAVERECTAGGHPDGILIRERAREGRLVVEAVRSRTTVARLQADFSLGKGEAEALVLAAERRLPAVATDDRNAIRACRLLRLGFVSAIAILVRSASDGVLDAETAGRALEALVRHGRYNAGIVDDARRRLTGDDDG
jgi:predicted nucleic acid-binding protein